MTQVVTSERKQIAVRGFQMLIIGIMMNMGLAIIGFLAFVQFLWMLVTNEKNAFISDLGSSFRFWYDKAIAFLLGASEEKPFPWQRVWLKSILYSYCLVSYNTVALGLTKDAKLQYKSYRPFRNIRCSK